MRTMIPTRIVVDREGAARPPRPGDMWDVIFVRNDGWSLAAPNCLRSVAERIWAGSWEKVLEQPGGIPAKAKDVRMLRLPPSAICERIHHKRAQRAMGVAIIGGRKVRVCMRCFRWARRNGYEAHAAKK